MALGKMNALPEESIYVGDSYEDDILGAMKTGILPVLIDRCEKYSEADCIKIRNLNELIEILENHKNV
ncbi:MAG: HAD hydrolase-like protein [Candidatus Parvarchaeota archaeon]|jgi:putative hydrolase of the HAD superfamily|nr:HAD hydrolase-like protein [Candidatus Parvarchaeota archaeon]